MMSNCCNPVFTWCPIVFTLCQGPLNWCLNPARSCCYGAHFMNHNRLVYDVILLNSCTSTVSLEDESCPKIVKNKA
jgi:hypothetical protein